MTRNSGEKGRKKKGGFQCFITSIVTLNSKSCTTGRNSCMNKILQWDMMVKDQVCKLSSTNERDTTM